MSAKDTCRCCSKYVKTVIQHTEDMSITIKSPCGHTVKYSKEELVQMKDAKDIFEDIKELGYGTQDSR